MEGSEKIPGGKLLAQYCCKVMIAHWQSIHEGPKQKLEKVKGFLESGQLVTKYPNSWCRKCGAVDIVVSFFDCPTHGYFCKSTCMVGSIDEERICPKCAAQCQHLYSVEQQCQNMTYCTKTCDNCDIILCPDHRQFCQGCGERLCTKGCFDEHSCAQGRKRAKKGK